MDQFAEILGSLKSSSTDIVQYKDQRWGPPGFVKHLVIASLSWISSSDILTKRLVSGLVHSTQYFSDNCQLADPLSQTETWNSP